MTIRKWRCKLQMVLYISQTFVNFGLQTAEVKCRTYILPTVRKLCILLFCQPLHTHSVTRRNSTKICDTLGVSQSRKYTPRIQWLLTTQIGQLNFPHRKPKSVMPCLMTVVLWKHHVFWEIQSTVTTDKVTGVHECFKFIHENVSLCERRLCKKCNEKAVRALNRKTPTPHPA